MEFEQEIKQLTASVWESILQLPIEPAETALPSGTRTFSASVQITGVWTGTVLLSCGAAMAAQAAGIMLNVEPADAALADIQDAMGELVNMIGGNIKALLPETCRLSLPTVVEGSDYSVRVPGSTLVTNVAFRCAEHAVCVCLLRSNKADIQ